MVARNNGHGGLEPPRGGRRRRSAIVAGLIALAALAFIGGYVLANDGGAPTVPTSTPASTDAPVLDDGRHVVFARSAVAAPASLRFDLAEFLTGAEAVDAAAEHGDEVTDGHYIVNDNPRLRSLPVADAVRVRYIPVGTCCDLVDGTWQQYVGAVDGTAQTDLDADAPWWITVRGDEIVRIEQQFLP